MTLNEAINESSLCRMDLFENNPKIREFYQETLEILIDSHDLLIEFIYSDPSNEAEFKALIEKAEKFVKDK